MACENRLANGISKVGRFKRAAAAYVNAVGPAGSQARGLTETRWQNGTQQDPVGLVSGPRRADFGPLGIHGGRTDRMLVSRGGEWSNSRSAAIPMGGNGRSVKPSAPGGTELPDLSRSLISEWLVCWDATNWLAIVTAHRRRPAIDLIPAPDWVTFSFGPTMGSGCSSRRGPAYTRREQGTWPSDPNVSHRGGAAVGRENADGQKSGGG
jgi:hypothetical protein